MLETMGYSLSLKQFQYYNVIFNICMDSAAY